MFALLALVLNLTVVPAGTPFYAIDKHDDVVWIESSTAPAIAQLPATKKDGLEDGRVVTIKNYALVVPPSCQPDVPPGCHGSLYLRNISAIYYSNDDDAGDPALGANIRFSTLTPPPAVTIDPQGHGLELTASPLPNSLAITLQYSKALDRWGVIGRN